MLRVGSWLYGRKPNANSPTRSLTSLVESQDLVEDAMAAASLILNDDVDGAEEGLSQGTSSFHKLGKGVVGFIRATLGFEQEIIREASERLYEAETGSSYDLQKVQSHVHAPNALHPHIYAPGTEYALCQAMAQIMGAVVGVLNESLTESIKAFYKLRKAFITLDGIVQMEEKYLQTYHETHLASSSKSSLVLNPQPEQVSYPTGLDGTTTMPAGMSSSPGSPRSPRQDQDLTEKLSELRVMDEKPNPVTPATLPSPTLATILGHSSTTVDAFVHSGSNLCFGMLLLVISMVPPAFSKLLYVIGFRGDKERGLKMLWQASRFQNMMGAIAALALLGYYHGFVRYCDIIPDRNTVDNTADDEEDVVGYPAARLMTLLTEMRARYPKSQLWLLEESRMKGAHRNLDAALELLSSGTESPLKQVEALRTFEKSMNAMYLHRYELCSQSFLECVELNSWSRSLYYYIAGSAQLALYRQHAQSDPRTAAEHAQKAAEYFRKAPTQVGKRRFMARQSFDIYVTRKVAKWEARAKEWKVDLVDAVGVDPLEEMIFFWNGYNRMTAEQLQESLRRLAWSESEANKSWDREGLDEKAILFVLRAAVLRFLREHKEAKEILETQIFAHDKASFKGHLMDEWTCPAAHFEMAANIWMERPTFVAAHGDRPPIAGVDDNDRTIAGGRPPLDRGPVESEREMVRECKVLLDKVAKWESYDLDTRIGFKVTAAEEAVQRWEAAHPTTETY